jgi:gliding motility-associated-like protein
MKLKLLFSVITFSIASFVFSQSSQTKVGWKSDYQKSKSFIENKGQFDSYENSSTGKIKYAVDFGATRIFFGDKGISYSFLEATKIPKEIRDQYRVELAKSAEERRKFEKLVGKFSFKEDEVNMIWQGKNRSSKLTASGETKDYHNYSYKNSNGEIIGASQAKGFTKVTYSNLYPNIDVEYTVHPEIGIKYAIILHPGADPKSVSMVFDRELSLLNGKLDIPTVFGSIVDHEPLTFYESNKDEIIASRFVQTSKQIQFELANYDNTKTVVIDPWTQTPNFNTNWDVVWECERDATGNVYILGGIMPMQILKYNSTGTLQWTYNTPYDTSNVWLGTFAVDNAGNSYVTAGSSAQIQKVSTAGALTWNNSNPGGLLALTEFWNISFSCDQTKLVIGGTDGPAFGGPIPYVFNVNMTNGNVISSQAVTGPGQLFSIPPNTPEVRSITATRNNKYYFMTHDSIGYISDNLSLCPGSNGPFHVNNGYNMSYKCENFRYDNSGIEAIAYYGGFIFVNRGTRLDKRDFYTGAILQSATIPGGGWTASLGQNQTHNSGISIDDCGNIFVGSKTGVYKFDQTLAQTGFYSTAFSVYDVEVNTNGEVIACGGTGTGTTSSRTGGVQTFAASACTPQTTTCCDASFCPPQGLCATDAPITLTPATPGGTWSGPGVNASGVFNPATAGPGVHIITYTLGCGAETIQITVGSCATLTVCQETNGTLTVSGGVGPYTWENWVPSQSTPITNQTECQNCGYTWFFGQCLNGVIPVTTCNSPAGWASMGTGTNMTAPGGWTQIQITDNTGSSTIITPGSVSPCSANPCAGVIITGAVSGQSNVSCFGGTNGAATVTGAGGTASYSYSWTPGSLNGTTQSALSAGAYTVTITDANSCTGTTTVTITQPTALTATATSTPATCGSNNGTATVTPTGGTTSYSYAWSPSGGTGATASNLASGSYSVTVTDGNGCTTTASTSVGSNGGPSISLSGSSDVSCNGDNDGTATVTGSGGTGTLSYNWTPGNLTGTSQNALTAGTYTVTVTDQNGCANSTSVTINEPSALTLTQGTINPANCGASDGSASVNGSGGTGALSYTWTPNVSTTAFANNIAAGSYIVVAADQNGCSATVNFTVSSIGGPTVSIASSNDVSCFGSTDGDATASATGGTAPYTYSWSPSGGSAATTTGLAAGNYTVTVTDNTGCIGTANVTIGPPSAITLTEAITDASCGNTDGQISVVASGGAGGFTYSWTPNGETTSSINNLGAGNYGITVTDANNCSKTENYSIVVTGSLTISVTPGIWTLNAGESVQLNATGADSYTWTPSNGLSCTDCQNPIASPSISTTYTVTGTDASGCTGTAIAIINVTQVCGDLYVPTVFSPNGTGPAANNILCVMGSCIAELNYAVYNRWGEKVFETADKTICWDGKYKGKDVNTGVYAYKLIATLFDGTVIEESGNLTIIR